MKNTKIEPKSMKVKSELIKNIPIFIWVVLIIIVLSLGISTELSVFCQEEGFKFLKNYNYSEYYRQTQNWQILQSKNGLLHVATNGGILEYDGVSWRIIATQGNALVRSIAIDEEGTIYLGGINKIGYLTSTSEGQLYYISLLNYIKGPAKKSFSIRQIHAIKDNVYFQTTDNLFKWNTKNNTMSNIPGKFISAFECMHEYYVQQSEIGLMKINGDETQLIPGGEQFTNEKVEMMVPFENNTNRFLIGTHSKGLYLYDGKSAVFFKTEADLYLKNNKLSQGIRLQSNTPKFALATLGGGLIVINSKGQIISIFDKNFGLQDERVNSVFQDKEGNLWLCLDNGITKIEFGSPISIFDKRTGLNGIVLSVLRHQNNLYVGTEKGLYYYQSLLKFQTVNSIHANCTNLISVDDSILAATDDGIFQIQNNRTRLVTAGMSTVLLLSTYYPNRVWCGMVNGLSILSYKNGQWVVEKQFPQIQNPIKSITEDRNGNLWLSTSSNRLTKITAPINTDSPNISHYSTPTKYTINNIFTSTINGNVILSTNKGLFKPDSLKYTISPSAVLGQEFAGGVNGIPIFQYVEDEENNLWVQSKTGNFRAIPRGDGSYDIDLRPFLRIPITTINSIYSDPKGKSIWLAGLEGLIRIDTTKIRDKKQTFPTLIRKVVTNENRKTEAQLFGGWTNQIGKASQVNTKILEYKNRYLDFEFAAPFFEAETETEYRYILNGYQDRWSKWSKNTRKNFSNLSPGNYSFRVQARNVYGEIGQDAEYCFKILPPWFLTWWAFFFYGAGLILTTYTVVQLRSAKLIKEKKKLEQAVKDRTKEINEKNRQLSDQSERLKEMDKVKSRFFANISHEFRTPLTLIISPLEQMLSISDDKQQKKDFRLMLRNAQRLLNLINQLLDLSRVDSGKMKLNTVHLDLVVFLKGIINAFEVLVQKNHLELKMISAEKELFLFFDPHRMEEVMYNLLINAIKFTPQGGSITISLSFAPSGINEGNISNGDVLISVKDTGTGIPEEELDYIFDRFYQADNRNTAQYRGTGLGLALSKEIIQLHKGTIEVFSHEGKGTEFIIRLPSGSTHLEMDEISSTTPVISFNIEKLLSNIESVELESVEGGTPEELDKLDTSNKKIVSVKDKSQEKKISEQEQQVILVVEDNADMRQYISGPLRAEKYEVVEAIDGDEGIQKARAIIPDLILSDIMMPGKEGFELCKILKKDMATSHIPIILLTARVSEESVIRGLDTGADDYVTKPFNTQILLARIRNLIELRRQLQLKIQRRKMLLPAEITVSSQDDQFLKDFQQIIEENLSSTDLDIDVLHRKLLMGRTTLFRKVKALTGENPMEFIQSYRLERAAQLLKKNFGNVTEVAMAVGFSTPSYFSECFKKKFHVSPHQYKVTESESE